MNNNPILDETLIVTPPSVEDYLEMKSHNFGGAMRLALTLGRPLEDWELEIFKIKPSNEIHELIILPNGRAGIAS